MVGEVDGWESGGCVVRAACRDSESTTTREDPVTADVVLAGMFVPDTSSLEVYNNVDAIFSLTNAVPRVSLDGWNTGLGFEASEANVISKDGFVLFSSSASLEGLFTSREEAVLFIIRLLEFKAIFAGLGDSVIASGPLNVLRVRQTTPAV